MNTNNLLIAGATGAAVYYFFPQVKETLISGSGAGSSGTSGFISSSGSDAKTASGTIIDGTLTKKQLSFISGNLDNTGDTIVNTTSLNSFNRATITTNASNIKKVESAASIGINAGNDTTYLYKKNNKIVGGSDFGSGQSLTKKAAKNVNNTKNNSIVTISRGVKINHNSKGINGLTDNQSSALTKKQIKSYKYLTGGY